MEHIKKVRDGDLYTPKLRDLNNNRLKYGHAHGMMKKAIDLALVTNSYEELMSMCQDFLNSKQETLNSHNLGNGDIGNEESCTGNEVSVVIEIANPVISVRKGRPAERAKSAVEIQDKENKRNCLKPIDLNIQQDEIQLDKDNRRKCHKCRRKGHNRTTCKFDNED